MNPKVSPYRQNMKTNPRIQYHQSVKIASNLFITITAKGECAVMCYRKHDHYACIKLVSSYEKEWYALPAEIREVAYLLSESWEGIYRELIEASYTLGPDYPDAA